MACLWKKQWSFSLKKTEILCHSNIFFCTVLVHKHGCNEIPLLVFVLLRYKYYMYYKLLDNRVSLY